MLIEDVLRVLATAYYTPGILDVLLALLDRGENSTQALWALNPFKYVGRSFSEMYIDCLKSNTTCFAIFRTAEHGRKIPFVWTLPPADTVLKSDDLVYVMATKDYIMSNRLLDIKQVSSRKIQRAVRSWLKRRRLMRQTRWTPRTPRTPLRSVRKAPGPLGYDGYLTG